jgi:hypothetical protein
MSAWQHCLRKTAIRALELIILQFLVVVILPNNEVGTPELPAVGAAKVSCSAGNCSIAPAKDKLSASVVLFVHDCTTFVGDHSLVASRHAAITAADDILQLSRRLRI